MPTPSLVNIPFITAPNVLFSQIPESGAGDFTVSRTTSPTTNRSTRVNANGLLEFVNDNVPRLDYPLGGAVNGCPALLVEPSAENFVIQSEAFNTAGVWNLTNATAPNTTATLDPFGNTNADIFTANAAFGRTQSNTLVAGATGNYTMSCFIKGIPGVAAVGSLVADRGVGFTITSGGVITVNAPDGYNAATSLSIQNYGNGWYRVFATWNYSGVNLTLLVASSVSGDSFYIFGAQLEAGSVPTSYIRTTTQAITRGAEVIRKTGITSLIGQSEGTVYFEVEVTDEARNKWFCTLDSASNSYIQMWISPSRTINAQILNNGNVVMPTLGSSALSVGYHKIAFAYNTATNGCIMYVDGVQNPAATTQTVVAPGLPAFNDMSVGNFRTSTTDTLKAHVRADAVYPNRLSNLDLEFLTAPVTYTTYAQMANALSYILP